MKVHYVLPSGRLLCGRKRVLCPGGYGKAAGTPTRTTRLLSEVTCADCRRSARDIHPSAAGGVRGTPP